MPTATDIIVSNMALSHIGAGPITSLSEDNERAEACDLWLEWARQMTLQMRHWNFAQKRARLVRHPHPYPDLEWTFRYKYPSDALYIRRLLRPGGLRTIAIPFTVEEGDIDTIFDGAFDEDDSWTGGTGWSVAAGVATGTTASSDLSQTIDTELTEGASYTVTYTLTRTAGSVTPKVGGTAGTTRSASGTYSEAIVAGTTDVFAFTGAGFSGTIDNVSLAPSASKTILTDLDDAMALYTVDMDTHSRWSPLAIQAWSFMLANAIAFRITGKNSIKDRMLENFQAVLREAAAVEGNEGHSAAPRDADWILARSAGADYSAYGRSDWRAFPDSDN